MSNDSHPATWNGPGRRPVIVESVHRATREVLDLTLVDPDGDELPSWAPGAHIDVIAPSVPVRQYSLCGDPADRRRYRIGVLRSADPGGSSQWLPTRAVVGRELEIDGPRNRFALADAPGYLFIAGGIGITPILPMLRDASSRGAPWRLVYGARTREHLAFTDEIQTIQGGQVDLVPEDERGALAVDDLVRGCRVDVAVYGCGPGGLLRALEEAGQRWRPARPPVVERFSASTPPPVAGVAGARKPFEVELRRSGVTLTVPANRTLLSVVRDAVPGWPSSCEEGVCGTCETAVLDGIPEHHDEVLTPAERAEGATMMICVGRSSTPVLVLDL